MKKEIIVVDMDDREPKSINAFNDTLELGMTLERKRMSTGDYVCGNVCVERKEISDFCGSIMDGRIENQVKKMKEAGFISYVIIVGSIKQRSSEINENCVLGMISKLAVELGVCVLMVDDDFQFLYLIKRIFERHRDLNKKIEGIAMEDKNE
jgi:Fanconi anemia group M protein